MTFDSFWTYFRLYLAVLGHTVDGRKIERIFAIHSSSDQSVKSPLKRPL